MVTAQSTYIQYIEYHSVCPLVRIGTPPPHVFEVLCFKNTLHIYSVGGRCTSIKIILIILDRLVVQEPLFLLVDTKLADFCITKLWIKELSVFFTFFDANLLRVDLYPLVLQRRGLCNIRNFD